MERRRRLVGLVVGLALSVLVGCGGGQSGGGVDHRFEIPDGAQDRISRGEKILLMPATLEVHVGDTLTVINDDRFDQSIGPYFVGAGETLRQTFKTAGTLVGDCAFTVGGRFEIRVRP